MTRPSTGRGGEEDERRRGTAAERSICRQNGFSARALARASDPCGRRRLGSAPAAVARSCRLSSEHATPRSTKEATATLSLSSLNRLMQVVFCFVRCKSTALAERCTCPKPTISSTGQGLRVSENSLIIRTKPTSSSFKKENKKKVIK